MSDYTITANYCDQRTAECEMELPLKARLSFSTLFDHWDGIAADHKHPLHSCAVELIHDLAPYSFLREPIDDESLIDEHSDKISRLLSPLFSDLLTHNEIKAATLPFKPVFFNLTERFKSIYNSDDSTTFFMREFPEDDFYRIACGFLASAYYGAPMMSKAPMFFESRNKETGMVNHYRAFFNGDFGKIVPTERTPKLTQAELHDLVNHIDDVEVCKKYIPPHSFELHGFGIVTLFDVTSDESIGALKNNLLKSQALYDQTLVKEIESNLSSLLKVKNLRFGISTYDDNTGKLSNQAGTVWSSMLMEEVDSDRVTCQMCANEWNAILNSAKPHSLPDVQNTFKESAAFKMLKKSGLKSYLISPLYNEDRLIGFLELGSDEQNALNNSFSDIMMSIAPLFSVALNRSITEYQNKVDSLIQSQFTAVHPSVKWKFLQVAEKMLADHMDEDDDYKSEEVVFSGVMPLFSQADIMSSSTVRNEAIRLDMLKQINLAKEVFEVAQNYENLSIYDHLKNRLQNVERDIQDGVSAGEETAFGHLLKAEIYPAFNHLSTLNTEINKAVEKYKASLDPDIGLVYEKRKKYENDVTTINRYLSDFMDKQQNNAQKAYPHYFEKFVTDGVEINMYIGQSIQPLKKYDRVYYENLRLWQLETLIGMEHMHARKKKELNLSLDIRSLILVHGEPISVRFRRDEKRFDVDGAYNMRYEIIKKRIDKALIKGTNERLTQRGKIAIVYSTQDDAAEYMRYADYFRSKGLIKGKTKIVNLEELQGASGLKAIRLEVDYSMVDIENEMMESMQG